MRGDHATSRFLRGRSRRARLPAQGCRCIGGRWVGLTVTSSLQLKIKRAARCLGRPFFLRFHEVRLIADQPTVMAMKRRTYFLRYEIRQCIFSTSRGDIKRCWQMRRRLTFIGPYSTDTLTRAERMKRTAPPTVEILKLRKVVFIHCCYWGQHPRRSLTNLEKSKFRFSIRICMTLNYRPFAAREADSVSHD
jgi:hypothetical protein